MSSLYNTREKRNRRIDHIESLMKNLERSNRTYTFFYKILAEELEDLKEVRKQEAFKALEELDPEVRRRMCQKLGSLAGDYIGGGS